MGRQSHTSMRGILQWFFRSYSGRGTSRKQQPNDTSLSMTVIFEAKRSHTFAFKTPSSISAMIPTGLVEEDSLCMNFWSHVLILRLRSKLTIFSNPSRPPGLSVSWNSRLWACSRGSRTSWPSLLFSDRTVGSMILDSWPDAICSLTSGRMGLRSCA